MSFQKITLTAMLCIVIKTLSISQSPFQLSTSRVDNTFEINDFMSFNIEAQQSGMAEFSIRHAKNIAPLETGQIPIQAGKNYNIFFSLPYEGTVWFEVKMGNQSAITSATFSPFQIQPKEEAPADFDTFWARKIQQLNEVPIDAKLRFHSSNTYSTTYNIDLGIICLLYTSPSPRDLSTSRMPSSA